MLAEAVREASLRRRHGRGGHVSRGGGQGEHSRQRTQRAQRPRGETELHESEEEHEGLCKVFRAALAHRHRNRAPMPFSISCSHGKKVQRSQRN